MTGGGGGGREENFWGGGGGCLGARCRVVRGRVAAGGFECRNVDVDRWMNTCGRFGWTLQWEGFGPEPDGGMGLPE